MAAHSPQRVLVTGGAGFIGSHVAELFLDKGYEVTVADNLSSGRRENIPAKAEFIEVDIATSEGGTIVREGRFDIITHLAAQIDVRASVAKPLYDLSVNIHGTVQLMEAVRASGHTATRVIFSSTGGALYGDFAAPPHGETIGKDPDAPYGIGKLAAEYYLAYYARVHGMNTVVLRYANVYGPRQDPHGEAGVVAIFCGRLLEGRPMSVYGDGSQTRDYVFVKDVARANLAAATHALPPAGRLDARAFNIGTGVETSVTTLAKTLAEAAGQPTPKLDHLPARAGELHRSAVDIRKSATGIGWRPTVNLHDGLAETYQWFAARLGASARTPRTAMAGR